MASVERGVNKSQEDGREVGAAGDVEMRALGAHGSVEQTVERRVKQKEGLKVCSV